MISVRTLGVVEWLRVAAALLIALAVGQAGSGRAADPGGPGGPSALGQRLDQLALDQPGEQALVDFYQRRGDRPLWFEGRRLTTTARALAHEFQRAASHGLRPHDYIEPIRAAAGSDIATLELTLTRTLLRYASHLARGRVEPRLVDAELDVAAPPFAPGALLEQIAAGAGVGDAIARVVPGHPGYEPLRRAMMRLEAVSGGLDWPTLEPGPTLEFGQRAPAVGALKLMLTITGDLPERFVPAEPDLFDDQLRAAVIRFQSRHGLAPDGRVGPRTRQALAVAPAARLEQIALNLERLRWVSGDLGERHVVVNLADFSLRMVERGQPIFQTRVVVGTPYHRTPVFTGRMTYLELNPYWNVPPSIARNEILPAVLDDPTYLIANEIEILEGWGAGATTLEPSMIDWRAVEGEALSFKFRQKPGPKNALGRIKFMFPNAFNVYLHDTPARALFDRSVRSFSHGCIRVEEPETLAALLLRDQPGWTRGAIERAIGRGDRQVIGLATPVPVHLTYLTSWVDEGGRLHFRDDIYGRDARLKLALDATSPLIAIEAPSLASPVGLEQFPMR
ncbi:MAG: L,D-transpeptidase family protein [Geminicoccaceae bacterium]|nr:L,D-transpeptidase family protein [Geminicoccaceae bacterium]